MKLDDETLLTAYLDGELEADELRRVESALQSVPALSDRLHELASVRDLVASLPRPPMGIDLTATVCVRIESRPPSFRLPSPGALARVALAASVLVALGLGLFATGPKRGSAPRFVATPPPRPLAGPPLVRFPSLPPHAETRAASPRHDGAAGAHSMASRSEAERKRLRALLDRPDVRRIFVLTDVLGGESSARVEALVQGTPRLDSTFGRIAVGQGILIDPEHPNEAIVYALVMDDRELQRFRATLSREFPRAVEEGTTTPDLVAQLGDVGQVSVFPGTSAAALERPAEAPPRVALKSETRAPSVEPAPRVDEFEPPALDLLRRAERFEVAGEPTPEQERSAPGHRSIPPAPESTLANAGNGPGAARDPTPPRLRGRSDPPRGGTPSIVLVWVTTRPAHVRDRR